MKSSSLFSRGIKQRLWIAFCLMSVIPILICLNFIFPSLFVSFSAKTNLTVVLAVMSFLALLGLFIARQIVLPFAALSRDAQKISEGDIERRVEVAGNDEIGRLGMALNQLSSKIRDTMSELEDYGTKTAQINLEIQKRVVVMSNLLQITSLISQNEKLDNIMQICVEKLKGLADSALSFVFFLEDGRFSLKAQCGLKADIDNQVYFAQGYPALSDVFKSAEGSVLRVDKGDLSHQKFVSLLGAKSLLCLPLFLENRPKAVMGIGSAIDDYEYNRDHRELLDIFGKQASVAIENDYLLEKVRNLEIRDELTGVYNERFIRGYLDDEIKRSIIYQRPCSFVLLRVMDPDFYRKIRGEQSLSGALKKIAASLSSAFTGIERLSRFGECGFAVVLPEKNKRQAQRIGDELRKKAEDLFKDEPAESRLRVAVSVAENPIDGVSSQELIAYAQSCFKVSD